MKELNVKVGDKVLYKGGSPIAYTDEIREVTRITPTGRIRINNSDCQFNKYGEEMGSGSDWYSYSISIPTEEDFERVKRNRAINKAVKLCNKVDRTNITYEQSIKIIDAILGGDNND